MSFPSLQSVNGKNQSRQYWRKLILFEFSESEERIQGLYGCVDGLNHVLSAGAKAGIAIGAVAGAAIIGVLIWLFIRRRKKRSRPASESHPLITNTWVRERDEKPELDGTGNEELKTAMLNSENVHEAPGPDAPREYFELDSQPVFMRRMESMRRM